MGIYGSDLDDEDWVSLRDALLPFIHAKNPAEVPIPTVPKHLEDHPLMECIRKYKSTGENRYLDQAGQFLVPTEIPFGWYLPLTK